MGEPGKPILANDDDKSVGEDEIIETEFTELLNTWTHDMQEQAREHDAEICKLADRVFIFPHPMYSPPQGKLESGSCECTSRS